MHNMPTIGELENMSIDELSAILVDDELLPLDDETNTDLILKITELIIQKEGKTAEQEEAELEAFCVRLTERYGDRIPIRVEDVVRKRGRRGKVRNVRPERRFAPPKRKAARILAVAAVLVFMLSVGNIIAVYAFQTDILRAIISFTGDLFNKTVISQETAQSPTASDTSLQIASGDYSSMQDALDDFGIERPKAPAWLPDGYSFVRTEVSDMPGRAKVLSVYTNGEREITISVISYSQILNEYSRDIEKSEGTPVVYNYNGMDFYIFSNLEMLVATWIDGMRDCDIQGNISEDEIKTIINSMYSED